MSLSLKDFAKEDKSGYQDRSKLDKYLNERFKRMNPRSPGKNQ